MALVTHRFRNVQRALRIVTVDMANNRYGNIVVIHTINQITDHELRRSGAVGHEQAGGVIAIASVMKRTQNSIGAGAGVKLIQIAIMRAKQLARQHVESHFYRQIHRADHGQFCIGKIQCAILTPRTNHICVTLHVDRQIEAIMRYHATVLDVGRIGWIEAFQVFFCNQIYQSVGGIVDHIIDVWDAGNHHLRCFDTIIDGIKA